MSNLSSADLTLMRATFDSIVLTSTATIETMARTGDSAGGYTDAWSTTATGVACAYVVPSGTLAEVVARISSISNYLLTFSWDQAISVGQRVTINSQAFIVNFVSDRTDVLCRRCYASLVE